MVEVICRWIAREMAAGVCRGGRSPAAIDLSADGAIAMAIAHLEGEAAARAPSRSSPSAPPGVPRRAVRARAALAVDVAHLPSHEQVARLRNGELDVALIHDPHDDGTIDTEPAFPGERLAAFLGVFHPFATCAAVSPEDLRGETLVVTPRAGDPALHHWLLAEVTSNGYAFRAIRETLGSDPRDVLFAVAENRGVALRPARPCGWRRTSATSWRACRSSRRSRCRRRCSRGCRGTERRRACTPSRAGPRGSCTRRRTERRGAARGDRRNNPTGSLARRCGAVAAPTAMGRNPAAATRGPSRPRAPVLRRAREEELVRPSVARAPAGDEAASRGGGPRSAPQ